MPPGPLTPEAKSALLATFTTHKTPESIDAAILAADRAGDTKEKNRLLGLKKQMSAAGREDSPESVTTSRQAETWRANQYADLEDRRLKAGTQQYNFATSRMETIPTITDAQDQSERERIERDYARILGRVGGAAASTSAPKVGTSSALKADVSRSRKSTRTGPSTARRSNGWLKARPSFTDIDRPTTGTGQFSLTDIEPSPLAPARSLTPRQAEPPQAPRRLRHGCARLQPVPRGRRAYRSLQLR